MTKKPETPMKNYQLTKPSSVQKVEPNKMPIGMGQSSLLKPNLKSTGTSSNIYKR